MPIYRSHYCKEVDQVAEPEIHFSRDDNGHHLSLGESEKYQIDYCPFCGKDLKIKTRKELGL